MNLSKLHRNMVRFHDDLCKDLGFNSVECISRVQLSRVLQSIDYESLNAISRDYFKIEVCHQSAEWYAIDGKELRGSIDGVLGEKRGENIVLLTKHNAAHSEVVGFYNGSKESEKYIVSSYFHKNDNMKGKGYSFDALHCSKMLLETIHQQQGFYLAQIKQNQKHLYEDLAHIHKHLFEESSYEQYDKGHGRIEHRKTYIYPVNLESLESKWQHAGVKYLVVVERNRRQVKNEKESSETAYFISNYQTDAQNFMELTKNHWNVEVGNNKRDANFGEDQFRSFKPTLQRTMASILTLVINGLEKMNIMNNLNTLREDITYDMKRAYTFFSNL